MEAVQGGEEGKEGAEVCGRAVASGQCCEVSAHSTRLVRETLIAHTHTIGEHGFNGDGQWICMSINVLWSQWP